MAAASFSAVAKDDLSCPICFELLRDPYTPKLLDCPHICCAVCIRKMVDGGNENIECPECRESTCIPNGDVDKMRTVLRVRNLAEKHHEMMKKNVQDVFKKQMKGIENVTSTKCQTHDWAVVDFYCKNCNIIGCDACMKYMHQGEAHCILKITAAHEDQRQQLDCIIKCVHEKVGMFKRESNQLDALRTEIKCKIEEQWKLIDTRKEYAISKLNEESSFLKSCIRKKAESRLDIINQEIDFLRMETEGIIEAISSFKSTVEESDPLELVTKHEDLAQSVYSLMDNQVKTHRYGNPVVGITKYNDYKNPLPLDMKDITLQIFQERILRCKCKGKTDNVFKLAVEVVACPDGVFAVHDAKKHKIYNIGHNADIYMDDTVFSKFSLNKLNPRGSPINNIAVIPSGKYLITRESHIDVYSADQQYEGQFEFQNKREASNVSTQYATKVIAMNDDTGRVVVGDEHNSTLTVVSRNQNVLRVFQISIAPVRMCSLNNGMIAVCNRQHEKVSIVDIEAGKEMHFLKIPRVLAACYHPHLDSLLVVRNTMVDENGRDLSGSGVVEQYGVATGRLIARLTEGLYYPQDVAISNDLHQIAVADSKLVRVFDIS